MAKKTTSKTETETSGESGAEIANTFGGSAVTTTVDETKSDTTEVKLSEATITLPNSALSASAPAPAKEPEPESVDNSFTARAERASIGLVRVEGVDFRYVGKSPFLDNEPKTPSGYPISGENSNFTPLSEVAFSPTIRVKIGDKFFFPQQATSWEGVELDGTPLVPAG